MADRVDPELLAALPLLTGVPTQDVVNVAERLQADTVDRGAVISREGETGQEFWILLKGEVSVSRTSPTGVKVLTVAEAGSVLGELALLRHQPRNATLTAATPVVLARGDAAALEHLLTLPAVRDRLGRLASSRLAHNLRPVPARLRDGTEVLVRPLLPEDREAYGQEIHRQSREFLRRRFFSPGQPSETLVDYLIHIDYVDHFAWVVVDGHDRRRGLAAARYVRTADRTRAEMAFGTSERYQGKGLGTFLLGALGVAAVEAGVDLLIAHVLEDNRPMRSVFAKAAAKSHFDEPGTLLVELAPEQAAALLPPDLRRNLAEAVHDVVTAASLALVPPPAP